MATGPIRGYPHVYNLGHPALARLFDGPVVIEEKIDGSQFSFGVFDGVLHCRSKKKALVVDAPEKMFEKAVEQARAIQGAWVEGWTYRCEYLRSPKHNTLAYDRIPLRHLMLLDVEPGPNDFFADPTFKQDLAARVGFGAVPTFEIENPSAETLTALLETESCLGGTKIEGLVIKNYNQFGQDGKALMGKHVSEAFKERHQTDWRKRNPSGMDVRQRIAIDLHTEARWEKAVQHLRDAGELTDSPRDIGALIKELTADVQGEEMEQIKEALFKWAWPDIRRAVLRGFPEWYKERLLEKQFAEGC